jgi:hypothetical protein
VAGLRGFLCHSRAHPVTLDAMATTFTVLGDSEAEVRAELALLLRSVAGLSPLGRPVRLMGRGSEPRWMARAQRRAERPVREPGRV